MYLNVLPVGYNEILEKLSKYSFIKNFYLSGGTALALQIGHRESVDFDFFSENEFNPDNLLKTLKSDFKIKDLVIAEGTLNCSINGIKLQFLHYPYILLEEFSDWDSIHLSSIIDIACTKMITVSSRGSKKDFIDIYYLLKRYNLDKIFKDMEKKYQNINFNKTHILKSLTSFEEADTEPMPMMLEEVSWERVKKEVESKTIEYLKSLV